MSSYPTVTRTWKIVPNIRLKTNLGGANLAGTSGTMQQYLYNFKQVMILSGAYKLKGSSTNGTGGMDNVDRWSSPSAIFAGTSDPKAVGGNTIAFPTGVLGDQAWVCLTESSGTGGDVVLSWMASTVDQLHAVYSQGGLMVASTYHVSGACLPTASDEIHFLGNGVLSSPIGGDTDKYSADRIVNYWISSDNKSFRVLGCLVSGTFLSTSPPVRWGVEQVSSVIAGGTCTSWSGSWGFAFRCGNIANTTIGSYNGGGVAAGGLAGMKIAGTFTVAQLCYGTELYNASLTTWNNIQPDAQSNAGYPIFPLGIGGITAPYRGKFANAVDQWVGHNGSPGDTYGSLQFIIIGTVDSHLWPWDGVTTPITS